LNSPIKSPASGVVTRVGYWGSYGLMVEIDHGFGITTRYGHLAKATVKKGQMVEFRQDVGTMGRSGRTTGPHLHYEVLFDGDPLDPANFLKAGRNVFKNGD
jgi:murein DD-endopeptidase MepM/ murein hydrolase activator NlpD